MPAITCSPQTFTQDKYIGLWIAIAIFSLWLSSLILLLPSQLNALPLSELILIILGRTFLQTGLFVIAHDAMHGNLLPKHRFLNNWIGIIALKMYAFLPYQKCWLNHWRHHQYPAQLGDPDFHDGVHRHPISWYFKFMREYLPLRFLAAFLGQWGLIVLACTQIYQIKLVNLLLIWFLPLILSSIQLFFFGTYLPHREPNWVTQKAAPLQSHPWITALSFLTCYHFGHYHQAHHQHPKTPWYKLPTVQKHQL